MNYFINHYKKTTNLASGSINLPSSKSESNRLLIMSALCKEKFDISKLSEARDTQTLHKLLAEKSGSDKWDVLDAGTAMRFLTAYLAVTTEQDVVLTGSERMQQRPIGVLVNALRLIGAEIDYLDNEGYPPLKIKAFSEQKADQITVQGNISSQYISALLMIAPVLPKGLKIDIEPPVYSLPYIEMTRKLMEKAGINVRGKENSLSIEPQKYKKISHEVESDWSAASYWYSLIALSELNTEILLKGLKKESIQGDSAIDTIMTKLGVSTTYTEDGALIKKVERHLKNSLQLDFKAFPDLAQTVISCCAALKVDLEITGLESLKIKETDRILALQTELKKFNCELHEKYDSKWELKTKDFEARGEIEINTYEDHRMAMSFAPLALRTHLLMKNAEVVNKSYPDFWKDLQSVGMQLEKK